MIPAMTIIGEQFQTGEIFIPELMFSARTMSMILRHFKDLLMDDHTSKQGNVIIGTVKGDLHDLGKNLVVMMLEGQGYTVKDLGVSVSAETFVRAVKDTPPDILAMSALLTTTMVEMKKTIDALEKANLRDSLKVLVGGAPLTQAFADQIGADGYAYDAPGAVRKCKALLSGKRS
jgi:5-methyltetrahydrofolate--homocysteine methyltransferase